MPITTGRKAIRFHKLHAMEFAIQQDKFYQHRHLIISYTELHHQLSCTRKELSEYTAVPINAVSKVVAGLVEEGALLDSGRMQCPVTGRDSRAVQYNPKFSGPY